MTNTASSPENSEAEAREKDPLIASLWCPQVWMYEEQPGSHLYYASDCVDSAPPTSLYYENENHVLDCCEWADLPDEETYPACTGVSKLDKSRVSSLARRGGIGLSDEFPRAGEQGRPDEKVIMMPTRRQNVLIYVNGRFVFPARMYRVCVILKGSEEKCFVFRRGYELYEKPRKTSRIIPPRIDATKSIGPHRYECEWDGNDAIVMQPPWPGVVHRPPED